MSRNRYAARTDENEKDIVQDLRDLGYTVETGHDDIIVGDNRSGIAFNFWFEIKKPEHVSKRTGKINESAKKDTQKKLEKEWKGQYKIVSTTDEILEIIKRQTLQLRSRSVI